MRRSIAAVLDSGVEERWLLGVGTVTTADTFVARPLEVATLSVRQLAETFERMVSRRLRTRRPTSVWSTSIRALCTFAVGA